MKNGQTLWGIPVGFDHFYCYGLEGNESAWIAAFNT